jgi:hypothetical protein
MGNTSVPKCMVEISILKNCRIPLLNAHMDPDLLIKNYNGLQNQMKVLSLPSSL